MAEEITLALLGFAALIAVPIILIVLPIRTNRLIHQLRTEQKESLRSMQLEFARLRESLGVASRPEAETPKPSAGAPPVSKTEPEPVPATPPLAAAPPTAERIFVEPVVYEKVQPIASEQPVAGAAFTASPPPKPTPRPAPVPRVPSRFEVAAKETLERIWNWIIVGEEHAPKGVSMEYAVASQWLLRIGILLVVVGVGYFLKYSIDNNLMAPPARVTVSTLSGLAMLIAGTQLLGRKYHVMGQGLMGGGLATLYFSAYAAANFYFLIGQIPAFALMACITALAGGIAVRFNSILVAVLGIIGGYGTPIMLSTGVVNFPGLFGYMLVLGIGVLAICYWKNWPLVNYLSFVCTYALFFAAMNKYEPTRFWEVFPFLIAFFVLFSTMTFLYKLVRSTKSNLLDLLAMLANAGVFFAVGYQLIDELYGQWWVAALSLGLTVFYITHIYYFLRRQIVDRDLLVSFLGLAAFFLAITMPLVLSRQWITASWAIQAVVLLWVAQSIGSSFVQQLAYLLLAVVLARFCFYDLGRQFSGSFASTADLPWQDYLRQLVERIVAFGIPIGSFGVAYRMVTRQQAAARLQMHEGTLVSDANDVKSWLSPQSAVYLLIAAAVSMLFFYLHLELNRTVGYFYAPARLPLLTLLWLGVCGLLLAEYLRRESTVVLGLFLLALTAVVGKLFLFDLPSWSVTTRMLYGDTYSFRDALMRLIDFAAVVGFLGAAYILFSGFQPAIQVRTIIGFVGLAMLFIYLTLEVNSFLHYYKEGLRAGGVSILWALFALTLVSRGIAHNAVSLRYLGLALFAIVSGKVFFVDLARLDQLWRIVAFVILGILLLAGSFVYLKYRETFATHSSSTKKDVL